MNLLKANNDIVYHAIVSTYKHVQAEYDNNHLCMEGSLQWLIYYYLRNYLSLYLEQSNLRIWCEYPISKWLTEKWDRIDIVIVEIDPDKMKVIDENTKESLHLRYCVVEIYALIELKFNDSENNTIFDEDKLNKLNQIDYPINILEFHKPEWTLNIADFPKYILGISENKTPSNIVCKVDHWDWKGCMPLIKDNINCFPSL